ncbi:MAG: zinc ABC transporter substrate-binding protein [Gammaproteobacteria bacterium]|nr:zinc ABC transporter substrate-binding protein [Gammaproteobacteria bacterium]
MPARADTGNPVPVVASFSIIADWLHIVGGDRIEVVTLVGADADAHAFRATPAQVRSVAAARLIFVNGLGFEGWLQRLLTASGSHAPVVKLSRGVSTMVSTSANTSGPTTNDPHAWHAVPNAMVYVSNIADALCTIDATGCKDYRARALNYVAELVELDAEIRKRFASVPPAQRKVITSHDAFGYLAREYGVEFLAAQGASTATEASAGHIAELITWAKQHRTPMFLENVADPRLLQQIGRETGHDPTARLYSDALSTPQGPAGTYVELMRYNTKTLFSAMLGE